MSRECQSSLTPSTAHGSIREQNLLLQPSQPSVCLWFCLWFCQSVRPSVRPSVCWVVWGRPWPAVEHVVCRVTTGLGAPGGCLPALRSSEDTSWPPVLSLAVSARSNADKHNRPDKHSSRRDEEKCLCEIRILKDTNVYSLKLCLCWKIKMKSCVFFGDVKPHIELNRLTSLQLFFIYCCCLFV